MIRSLEMLRNQEVIWVWLKMGGYYVLKVRVKLQYLVVRVNMIQI